MKYCPKCQTNYDDASYDFCLQDGERLVELSSSTDMPTIALSEEQTIASIKPTEQVRFDVPTNPQNLPPQVTQISPQFQTPPQTAPSQKTNTTQAVLLTALGMIALFGAAIGGWYFFGNRQTEITENRNIGTQNSNNQNSNRSPSPKPSTNTNAAKTPTPTPEVDAEAVKSEVSSVLYDWKSATESGDIDDCMSHYADSISFYGSQKSRNTVRGEKQAAFNKYDSMSINLSNMSITPDASGEKATAVFDKEWVFTGEKVYAGKVRSQFQLVKSGGRWLITSEKDVKIYYVRK